jgi:hypothetical protein
MSRFIGISHDDLADLLKNMSFADNDVLHLFSIPKGAKNIEIVPDDGRGCFGVRYEERQSNEDHGIKRITMSIGVEDAD